MMRPIISSSHNHYQLEVQGLAAEIDILSFKGEEWLSQPFSYTIEKIADDFSNQVGELADETKRSFDASRRRNQLAKNFITRQLYL
ncbi:hypothetical protein ACLEJW_04105 [Pseudomonas sp. SMSB3]|uniref:hypothetical protein n=1 Tax=unclassified Pseudomonas TaxID=196821 RepID=UPI0028A88350|nr:hypothetical protein [Pseudomonas sp.]